MMSNENVLIFLLHYVGETKEKQKNLVTLGLGVLHLQYNSPLSR